MKRDNYDTICMISSVKKLQRWRPNKYSPSRLGRDLMTCSLMEINNLMERLIPTSQDLFGTSSVIKAKGNM